MKAIAIRHVHFEDCGVLEDVLRERDISTEYFDAGVDALSKIDPLSPQLLVVLGGPIGAYEEKNYPFLIDEVKLLEARLTKDLPTLGICLGAQLIARALGESVFPGKQKEIGWKALKLTEDGSESSLKHLAPGLTSVLHWHGDTFDLPKDAKLLASTDVCQNQAFSFGKRTLALQFHPEVRYSQIERWLIGHACEIAAAGIDVSALRTDTTQFGKTLESQSKKLFADWIEEAELLRFLIHELKA